MDYIADIFTPKIRWWMRKYDCREVKGPNGTYISIHTDYKTAKRICRKAQRRRIKARYYNKRWTRSGDYRRKFLRAVRPPYRCRYCNKKLTENTMTVDHIIPVHKAKTSASARNILALKGIKDVNDIRNLAPACFKCNERKGSKTGLWVIRGYLGVYGWFHVLRLVLRIAVPVIILIICYRLYTGNLFPPDITYWEYIENFLNRGR